MLLINYESGTYPDVIAPKIDPDPVEGLAVVLAQHHDGRLSRLCLQLTTRVIHALRSCSAQSIPHFVLCPEDRRYQHHLHRHHQVTAL